MTSISILNAAGDFAGDKDVAASIRDDRLRPALAAQEEVVLDFAGVGLATQSFIHALISEPIRTDPATALDLLTFENCSAAVRELIEIVVEYSQDNVAGSD